jgi:hypothetical protein
LTLRSTMSRRRLSRMTSPAAGTPRAVYRSRAMQEAVPQTLADVVVRSRAIEGERT